MAATYSDIHSDTHAHNKCFSSRRSSLRIETFDEHGQSYTMCLGQNIWTNIWLVKVFSSFMSIKPAGENVWLFFGQAH